MRRIEGWLFAPGTAERVASVRIGLCSVLLVRILAGPFRSLAQQPPASYRPLSFMHLLTSMPPLRVVELVQILGAASAVAAALGLRPRITLPAAWACGVLLDGMATSVGKTVHNDVLLLLAMVPLLAARTGDAWTLEHASPTRGRNDSGRTASVAYGWPVRTASVVVAGGYFFSGLSKVMFSGPAWITSGNLRWILYASSDGHAAPNVAGLFVANRAWLATLMAAATMIVELGFPIVLWKPKAAWIFVPAAVALHAGIRLTMGLDYSAWALTAVVVFVDWPALLARARAIRARSRRSERVRLEAWRGLP
jgi:hypothetical protein